MSMSRAANLMHAAIRSQHADAEVALRQVTRHLRAALNGVFDQTLAKLKTTPGWKTYEVPCGHDVMVDMPDRLVEILLEVA